MVVWWCDRFLADSSTSPGCAELEQFEVLWVDHPDPQDERVYGATNRWAGCCCGT
jgi:hypothetical protein